MVEFFIISPEFLVSTLYIFLPQYHHCCSLLYSGLEGMGTNTVLDVVLALCFTNVNVGVYRRQLSLSNKPLICLKNENIYLKKKINWIFKSIRDTLRYNMPIIEIHILYFYIFFTLLVYMNLNLN